MNDLVFLFRDLREAARRLRRSPGFATVVLLVFAVGLGVTSAVFALLDAELLRPLPFPEADRLVSLAETAPLERNDRYEVSYPSLETWRSRSRDFESVAAYVEGEETFTSGERAQRLRTAEVSPEFFRTLGASPELGRLFLPDEAAGRGAGAVVVSRRLCRRAFGSRTDAVGRPVRIGGETRTVVGVMPDGFAFPSDDTDVWSPVRVEDWMRNRAVHVFRVVGRLKPGVRVAEANANLARIAASEQRADPAADPGHGATVRSLREAIVGPVRSGLGVLSVAVGLVWLIACADLAAMLLSRAERRKREIAIRLALGAGRPRIAAGMIAEGAVIGLFGGAAGYLAFCASIGALIRLLPSGFPLSGAIAPGAGTLAFSLAAGFLSGVVLSLGPVALLVGGGQVKSAVAGAGSAAHPRRRLVDTLVVLQIALCLVLMTGAGLLGKSFLRLTRVDPGFRTEQLLTMKLDLGDAGWKTKAEAGSFADRISRALRAVPAVRSASATSRLPISGGDPNGSVTVEGSLAVDAPPASFRRVFPSYFETMGIPVVRGRDFDAHDDGTRMVVVVSKALADRFWPGKDPVGRRIKVGPPEREPWLTVVGVVGDVRNVGLDDGPRFATYEPFAQRPGTLLTVVTRLDARTRGASDAIARAIHRENPGIAVYDVDWMTRRVSDSLTPRRTYTTTMAFFGAATLLLAGIGLFGLLSTTVAARTPEIGIRMAVGARAQDIQELVVGWGARRVLAGIGLGLPAALFGGELLARAVPGVLYEVSARDGATLAFVVLVLSVAGFVATSLPARRASRIDPMSALRFP